MFWLNTDLPTRIWKLHREDCIYCKPEETKSKGLGRMTSYGGWFSFKTTEEAYAFYESQGETYIWQPCKICKPDRARAHLYPSQRKHQAGHSPQQRLRTRNFQQPTRA